MRHATIADSLGFLRLKRMYLMVEYGRQFKVTRLHAWYFREELESVHGLLRVPLPQVTADFSSSPCRQRQHYLRKHHAGNIRKDTALYGTKPGPMRTDANSNVPQLPGLNAPTLERGTARVTFVKQPKKFGPGLSNTGDSFSSQQLR